MDFILDTLNHPQMRHSALVHLPIACTLLTALAAIVYAAMKGSSKALGWVTVCGCAVLLLTSYFAVQSGEAAQGKTGELAAEVNNLVHEHEEMAEKMYLFAGAALLCGLIAQFTQGKKRLGAASLTAIILLVAGGWVAKTAHYGGELVYRYDVGTPRPEPIVESAPSEGMSERFVFYESKVKPIFEAHCLGCHGIEKHKGGLILSTATDILKGAEDGAVVSIGDPDNSLLYQAITWEHDLKMPPPKKADQLDAESIEIIRTWIADGVVGP